MYDGNWTMVRATCAVDWCGVIDVGGNRIRRCCRNTPAWNSAFGTTCRTSLLTTKVPSDVSPNERLSFINELYQMNYLKPDQYFVEAVQATRLRQGRTEVKIKWVGYSEITWEPITVLNKNLRKQLKLKHDSGLREKLTA